MVPPDCPLTKREIVELPIDEFNELLEKSQFSEDQKAKFRDLRRKGKNRVAARKSREKSINWTEQLRKMKNIKTKKLEETAKNVQLFESFEENLKIAIAKHHQKERLRVMLEQKKLEGKPFFLN